LFSLFYFAITVVDSVLFRQLVIAILAGPIDGAFNKGNTPAFCIAGVVALICAVLAVVLLPKTRGMSGTAVMAGGH
jgi:solute carrier family 45, member 1/2/4